MYRQLKLSYEQGATYVAVFNYAPKNDGNGLLQEEHYAAMQKFWTNVVQNPDETNNYVVHTALQLSNNYGLGLRNQNDTIWGLWPADATSQKVWGSVQSALSQYGNSFDIVYKDASFPLLDKYSRVISTIG